jgi:hypothetical protein
MVRGKDVARLIHQSLVTVILEEPSSDTVVSVKELEKKFYKLVRERFQDGEVKTYQHSSRG